jgi:hypothetical protein
VCYGCFEKKVSNKMQKKRKEKQFEEEGGVLGRGV